MLNCIIRRSPTGYKIEGDPRHAERVVRGLGLEGSKGARLPGSKAERKHEGNKSFDEAFVAAVDSVASHRPGGSKKGKGCSIDNVSVDAAIRPNPVGGSSVPPTGGPSGTQNFPEMEATHTTPLSRSTTNRASGVESEDETELTGPTPALSVVLLRSSTTYQLIDQTSSTQ